ncbi:hypothetical protein Lesp01_28990 [Lentzea sp. NBRC 102530]|nr:hypothetical protein Lesp01_28990 [Lentzea sp. NBRC 102530]
MRFGRSRVVVVTGGFDVVNTGEPLCAPGASAHDTTPATSKKAAKSRNLDITIPPPPGGRRAAPGGCTGIGSN